MNDDYWQTHTVEEHEQKVKEINNRFVEGKLSRQDVEREISVIFGEDNPEFEQQERLEAEINSKISTKLRDKLSVEQYFALREKIREKILGSTEEDAEKARLEEARVTGEFCINCNSTDVVSYDSHKWFCKSCKKYFSKR